MSTETREGCAVNDHASGLDDETLAFAAHVFQIARDGDADAMRSLPGPGFPPDFGADPDRPNDKSRVPLAGVTFKGNLTLGEALVEHGTAVDAANSGRGPLAAAAIFGRTEIMAYLLDNGADPQAKDASGTTAAYALTVIAGWRPRAPRASATRRAPNKSRPAEYVSMLSGKWANIYFADNLRMELYQNNTALSCVAMRG